LFIITKKNYDKNVAIYLLEDKKHITGYPHPSDVSEKSYPTSLKNGYLLDNRGIGTNTAFISMTYEEYAALKNVPLGTPKNSHKGTPKNSHNKKSSINILTIK
jgi:hypothetical protein